MQNPGAFESFVRGIPTDMTPFAITEIARVSDTVFDVFLDVKQELRAEMGFEETKTTEGGAHDLRVFMSYLPRSSVLSMGVISETRIPPQAFGWALTFLNAINAIGNGYVSKISLPQPEPDSEDALDLLVGWEVGLYEPSLLEGEGLKALTRLIYSLMRRLCLETSFLSVELSQMYHAEFPSGKLDA